MSNANDQFTCCLEDAKAFLYVAKKMKTSIIEFRSPYITNLAIACELFLKAIAMKQNSAGTYKHVHELDELLSSLPVDARNKIEANFENKNNLRLNEFLKGCKSPFVEWRYQFEKQKIVTNIAALEKFADTLNEYCETF